MVYKMSTYYRYELAGFGDGKLYDQPKKNYELENMRFPVEAFKKVCEQKGIPYPFDTMSKPLTLPKAEQELGVVDGVTVSDIQKMCERSAAFHSVLKTVATWQNEENPERITEESLRASLRIAARKDKWGSDNGELAKTTQEPQIVKLILGDMRAGGRPKK